MLKYMPLFGSILLTMIIAWIVGTTIARRRREIRQALAGRYIRSDCCGSTTTPLGWTQDGWVSRCDTCGSWQYLGDDFDNPPPGFEDRHNYSRPLPAPRPSAASGPGVDGAIGARPTEVTSGCDLCGGELDHEPTCPRAILIDMLPDQDEPEGELILPPPPNMGGEGNPDYQGPHYSPETTHGVQTRFVPYDVLRDPVEGAAVHIVGNVACVGPLAVEQGDRGNADPSREEDES